MRKADILRAFFSALYTLNCELPEEERDPKLGEFLDRYMPNFGAGLPPKDGTLVQQFEKFVNKRHKEDSVSVEDAFETAKKFARERTEFGKVFNQVPLDDWKNLCDLIDMANTVDAVNAMKDSGEYEKMVRQGKADEINDYIHDHPELLSKADPSIASQTVGGMAAMTMGMQTGNLPVEPAKKKTVHPGVKNPNSKKKKKKK